MLYARLIGLHPEADMEETQTHCAILYSPSFAQQWQVDRQCLADWALDRLEHIGNEVCDTAVRTFLFGERPEFD